MQGTVRLRDILLTVNYIPLSAMWNYWNVNFNGREAGTWRIGLWVSVHTGRMGVQWLPEGRGQRFACTVPNKQEKSSHKQTPWASNSDKHCIVKGKDWLKLLVEVSVIEEDPDGWREAHSTCQEKQESSHQVAACTIDQTLGQFDVRHRGLEGRVTHSNQAEQQGTHCNYDAEGQGKLEDTQIQLVNG